MSAGKLAAQVAHASFAFISNQIRNTPAIENETGYNVAVLIDKDIMDNWFKDIFTKTVCEAKNKNQLLKAKTIAEEMGMKEGIDFFLIKDACNTELEPEEFDENGIGRTLTCIGFKPLPDEIAWKISKKFQLYR